ncbi:hypothetical protein FISHEDRAFT_42901 [Fistulina hepatica ATCC 64428]|uniref:Uncharacterized protein n=1 Tax=Fistulina hepatica ATCC 64428 TaxID=1128425 RepID=A0A0D7AFH8_9AGAR|nr:hypothetical protein FISHEDRAFT_42901 [Fistulina hepatica ATCC 64428]
MLSLFNKIHVCSPTTAKLAIIQYMRPAAGFGIGREEGFHWALVAVTDQERGTRGIRLHTQNVVLEHSGKFLGGVYIGEIGVDKLAILKKVRDVLVLVPCKNEPDWNCQSWAMETIAEVLIPNGWAFLTITSEASLLPTLRTASRISYEAMQKGEKPVVIDL